MKIKLRTEEHLLAFSVSGEAAQAFYFKILEAGSKGLVDITQNISKDPEKTVYRVKEDLEFLHVGVKLYVWENSYFVIED